MEPIMGVRADRRNMDARSPPRNSYGHEKEFQGELGMKKVLATLLAITAWLTPGAARADIVFANTTGGRLISFDSATPGALLSNVAISGVLGDLVGIDFRPADNMLYGVGNTAAAG